MRKLLILFVLLFVVSPMVGQDRRPDNERHRIVQYAQQFLVDQGFDPDKVQLRFEKVTKNIVFLNNPETRVFIVVAREQAAPYLHERVLAFSMGSTWAEGVDDRGIENFFHYYDSTLTKMLKGKIPPETASPRLVASSNVASLLQYIKWRQFRLDPKQPLTLPGSFTGCGPTAVAQMMKFHEYPKDIIDWSKTEPKYPYPKGDTAFIAPLLLQIGLSVKANYGVKSTSSSMENIREGLVRDFGFSSRMFHAYHQVSEREMLQWVARDLTSGRPSLMCGLDHLFVCDGICGDFFHLNMGWGGNYDGWYRFITPQLGVDRGAMLDGVLVNIMPNDATDSTVVQLKLESPGQLSRISPDTLSGIVRLKVTGPLDGNDLRVLRHMAGSMMNDTVHSWQGSLCDLDLSDASIVKSSCYYHSYDAAQTRFWTSWKGKDYHFEKMTHKQWLEIVNTRIVSNDWLDIEETEPDRRYTVHLKTRDNVAGQSLFYSCQNLRWLKLPRNLKRIERYAFYFCPMLESVITPDLNQMDNEQHWMPDCKLLSY